MTAYTVRRLISAVPVLVLVSLVTFALMHIVPGDPAQVIAGPDATRDQIEAIRVALCLDRPLYLQLAQWYWHLFQGDLGDSYMLGRSVVQAIEERVPVTLLLSVLPTELRPGWQFHLRSSPRFASVHSMIISSAHRMNLSSLYHLITRCQVP